MMNRKEINKIALNIVDNCDYQRRSDNQLTVKELSERIEYDAYNIAGLTQRSVSGRIVKWLGITTILTGLYCMGIYGGRSSEREVMQQDCYVVDKRYALCERTILIPSVHY